MPSRDVILTTLYRFRFESAATFLASLRRTGYQGEIVAFVSNMEEGSVAELRNNGVSVVRFRFLARHARQHLAWPWPLWRRIFASTIPQAAKERLAHAVFHLFYRRHLLYLQFLRERRRNYDRVFLTDCRDVYFQAAPFSWNPPKGVHFFLEEETNRIGQCPHNSRWIRSQFGQSVLDEFAAAAVSCAGTVFGDIESIIEYLSTMVALSMKALSLREFDGDQGIHNYILRKRLLQNAVAHNNRSGPVMTLGPMRMADLRLNETGLVVNDAGQIVPVLHQYDRVPELKEILLRRIAT
jgi:hypothetical protein